MSSQHTTRLDERVLTLNMCFNVKLMESVWQKYVKNGMRGQNILDLHDYYDFHRNRKNIVKIIRKQILDGTYKPKPPLLRG